MCTVHPSLANSFGIYLPCVHYVVMQSYVVILLRDALRENEFDFSATGPVLEPLLNLNRDAATARRASDFVRVPSFPQTVPFTLAQQVFTLSYFSQ